MIASEEAIVLRTDKPIDLASERFIANRHAYYRRLREEAPVARAKVAVFKVYVVSRYEDSVALLKDP